MRGLAILLGVALVATGLALWLLGGDRGDEAIPPPLPAVPARPSPPVPTTGVLTIRVSAPDGTIPPGAEVGWVEGRGVRVLYAGEDGTRTFTDAPLGPIVVVARAPGCEPVRAKRRLSAGVPDEVRLVLRPAGP